MPETDLLLTAAATDFAEHGYAASSYSSIAARVGLTKGALVRRFPTKEHLAWGVIAGMQETLERQRVLSLEVYPSSGARALTRFFLAMAAGAIHDPRLGASVALFSDRSSPVYGYAQLSLHWRLQIEYMLKVAHANDELPPETNVRALADSVFIATLGSAVLDSQPRASRPSPPSLDLIAFTFRGIGVIGVEEMVAEVVSSNANGTLPELPELNFYQP